MDREEIGRKTSSYLGFARRSGKASPGTELAISAVRKASFSGKCDSVAVLISKDASERTKKQVTDKCIFYKVFCQLSELDGYDTGKALGKSAPVSAVAVCDKNLAKAIINLYSDKEGSDAE